MFAECVRHLERQCQGPPLYDIQMSGAPSEKLQRYHHVVNQKGNGGAELSRAQCDAERIRRREKRKRWH